MARRAIATFAVLAAAQAEAAAPAPVPSFRALTTGNGFGFAVFDAEAKKITQLLERPYRYLAPGRDPKGEGVYRRDLAYDIYFGARAGDTGGWMPDQPQTEVGFVEQSGIIRSVGAIGKDGAVKVESFYFSPFDLPANALVMIARATNTGPSAKAVELFALPNLHLGAGGDEPSAEGETITTVGGRSVETGALGESGGAIVYLPLAAVARASCEGGWAAVKAGQALPSDTRTCSGDDRTLIFQSATLELEPGQSGSFGLVIGFTPAASAAAAMGDGLTSFVAGRSPDKLLSDELAGWERWRKAPPPGLSDDERRVYRQAEATLRMSQVREPYREQPKQKGHGLILASLPPGIWNIGWVRDASYAIVALSRMGHLDEARDALRFFLSAEAGAYSSYTEGPYRISVTRYFGDGQEESDWNADGPNVELDGWGLFLWALRQYVDAAGDGAILTEALPTGENTIEVVRSGVADPLVRNLEPGGLVRSDTSIWESHWDKRKHYTFSSLAAARGLCDLASVEQRYGDAAVAVVDRGQSARVQRAIREKLLDHDLVLTGSKEGLTGTYHDAAVLEAFNWELFSADDPLYPATLSALEKTLRLPSGGWKRNDDGLSKYDSNEWVFVDLRAAQAHRRMGNPARADELVAWVTRQARVNFDLIPELFNAFPEEGPLWSYAGSAPMVGFGAAAYVLSLRARAGEPEAHDCGVERIQAGPARPDPASISRMAFICAALAILAIAGLTLMRRRR